MIDRLDIHAFADNELSPEEMAQARIEIGASPESSRELAAIESLKACLQAKAEHVAPEDVWHMCVGRLDELDRVKKAETFVGKYAWAISAMLFAVIIAGGMFNRFRGGSVGMAAVASMSSDLVPLQSPSINHPEQLRKWIGDQTGERPSLFTQIPAQVVGFAFSDQPQGRIVRVTMRDSNGMIDLMVIPNVARVEGVRPLDGDLFQGQINGINCVTWHDDSGCQLLLIGDRQTDQLRVFAQALR